MHFNIDNIDMYGRKTWAYSYIIADCCGTNMVFNMTLYNIYAHVFFLWNTHGHYGIPMWGMDVNTELWVRVFGSW